MEHALLEEIPVIENILAKRYATMPLKVLWTEKNKIILERRFWISALTALKNLGIQIPQEAIESYERTVNIVNLASIEKREGITGHDVKARIEEFNARAGYEYIHIGFTSRDLTDNIEQFQILSSLKMMRDKSVAVLAQFIWNACEYTAL